MKFEVNRLTWQDRRGGLQAPITVALICDVHDGPWEHIIPPAKGVDAILIAGDLTNRHSSHMPRRAEAFLKACVQTAPTWYTIGNHELKMAHAREWRAIMERSGAHVLDNTVAQIREDVWVGGLSSQRKPKDNDIAAQTLSKKDGFRLLLCHHPEYYQKLVSPYDIDLTLSGHAHGGQWINPFTGLGTLAPDQGYWPKYVDGLYTLSNGTNMVVSRGLCRERMPYPRFFNHPEIVVIEVRG